MKTRLGCSALFLGLALLACTVGNGTSTVGPSGPPVQIGQVTSPTTGLQVTATIIAATLGDDCGGSSAGAPAESSGISADCAPTDAGADGGGSGGAAKGGCGGGSFCQQSNVQLSFKAGAGSTGAKIEIVSVTLHDGTSGSQLDDLTASKPQIWSGSGYVAWDQTVKPNGETKASYNLSAPSWSTLSSGGSSTSTYAAKYRLQVTVKIDGAQVTLESAVLSREPMVAT